MKRLQLRLKYRNGKELEFFVNYVKYADGEIHFTACRQVQPCEIVSVPVENIAELDAANVECEGEGWKTVKEAREAKGLSRAELARMLDIPVRTLENWDAGTRKPPEWVEKLVIERIEDERD